MSFVQDCPPANLSYHLAAGPSTSSVPKTEWTNPVKGIEYRNDAKLEEKLKKLGLQITTFAGCKVLCPLSGPITTWPYGREVFLSNLPPFITEYMIYSIGKAHGNVLQVRLPIMKNGVTKKYGYVLYESRGSAINAVLKGFSPLKYLQGSWKIQACLSSDNRRLFIKNLPYSWTVTQIERLVSTCCVGFNRVVLFKKEFCFIEFKSHYHAGMAKGLLKNILKERVSGESENIIVNWAYPEPMVDPVVMQKVKTLFIRGLPCEVSQNMLLASLENLLRLPWWFFSVKKEKDFAFVSFLSKSLAEESKQLLEGTWIHGGKISVSWARPNDPRCWMIPGASRPQLKMLGAAGETPVARGTLSPADQDLVERLVNWSLEYAKQHQMESSKTSMAAAPPYNWWKWSDGTKQAADCQVGQNPPENHSKAQEVLPHYLKWADELN